MVSRVDFLRHMSSIGNYASRFFPKKFLRTLQNYYVYRPVMNKYKSLGDDLIFNSVFFEVRSRCNGACTFCAASVQNENRPDLSMSFNLYKKVIDDLARIGYSGRISYHINNDPLLFKPLPEFIGYARHRLPKSWIQILTNGRSLTPEKADRIIAAGLNELSINVYGHDKNAPLPQAILDIRYNVLPKYFDGSNILSGFGPSLDGRNIFRFSVFRRLIDEVLETRGGTSPNKPLKSDQPRGFCSYPFEQLNINALGQVSKCCCDFFFADPMGDLAKGSVMDIWNGTKFREVRRRLIDGDREALETCRNCDFYGVFGEDRYLPSHLSKLVYAMTK